MQENGKGRLKKKDKWFRMLYIFSWTFYFFYVLFLLAFIWCCIYSQALSFCFFSFFWEVFFFCATSSGLEKSALFPLGSSQCGRGSSCMGLPAHELCTFCPASFLGALFTGSAQWPESLHLNPQVQYHSAFLSLCSKNFTLFLGHWPSIQPHS